jgi:hypothetical protein
MYFCSTYRKKTIIMAKRFTDTEKWKDVWYTDLSNDNKIIWQYLLDTCDESGILKFNLRLLNFNCSTNITVEEFISIFKDRVTPVNKEYWVINKFCYFQYGPNFLTSNNKVVIKAIGKLLQLGLIKEINGAYTLSIPYQYPIDTPQEEEQIEEQIEIKEKIEEEVKEIKERKRVIRNLNKDISRIVKDNNVLIDKLDKENFELLLENWPYFNRSEDTRSILYEFILEDKLSIIEDNIGRKMTIDEKEIISNIKRLHSISQSVN